MLFAHDTEVSLNATAALVNTARGGREELPDLAALDQFIEYWRWTGSRTHDQAELDAVRALRPRLARLWDMTEDEAAALVNTLLRDAERAAAAAEARRLGLPHPRHLAGRAARRPDGGRRGDGVRRRHPVRRARPPAVCAADDCDDVVVDLSKNRSRRFCGLTCANRVNVAAYRSRRSAS